MFTVTFRSDMRINKSQVYQSTALWKSKQERDIKAGVQNGPEMSLVPLHAMHGKDQQQVVWECYRGLRSWVRSCSVVKPLSNW